MQVSDNHDDYWGLRAHRLLRSYGAQILSDNHDDYCGIRAHRLLRSYGAQI